MAGSQAAILINDLAVHYDELADQAALKEAALKGRSRPNGSGVAAAMPRRRNSYADSAIVRDGSIPLPLSKHQPNRVGLVREGINDDENTYKSVSCLACTRMHLVNLKTGKVLGVEEED